MKLLNHICYDITLDHLIEHYVSLNYYLDTVVVIHNPTEYLDLLEDVGLYFNRTDSHFDKIMVVQVETIHDGIYLLHQLHPGGGPFCTLWHRGERISDNIEENLRFAN